MTTNSQSDSCTGVREFDPEDLRITIDDGVPAVEFPTGQILRLRTHVTVEDRFERPLWGRGVELDAEVDADDFAWWTLYPSDDEEEWPELCIEPEFTTPGGDDGE